jgi:Family of unknown function (DUF6455)
VCHAGTEQSRWSETEALQIDQNQCRHLKGYYGFDQPKSVAGAGGVSRVRRPSVITLCRAMSGGEAMTTPVPEYSAHIYEMMTRLGVEPSAGVLPHLSLRYATAVRRCENCRSKMACQDWLDYAPAMLNFAPDFCMNADILFDLQYDQAGPRFQRRIRS